MNHREQVRSADDVVKTSVRRGLTLIELLVTIVIMVTVLAGVLPLVSPNNNARKIREASRQLTTLFSQAQAQAARDGRPVGVAFKETGANSPYSGMALEAYLIASPPPFAGFSEHSRVVVGEVGSVYGPTSTFTDPRFSPALNGYKICRLNFLVSGNVDAFPPRTLKIGDIIEVGGNSFLVCDDEDQTTMPNQTEVLNNVEFLLSDPSASTPIPGTTLDAIWLNYHGQMLPQATNPPSGQAYKIYRQPVNTSEQPLQFPRGIGIDMDASGATGLGTGMPIDFDVSNPFPTAVSVMFSPNGSIETVYRDGVRRDGVEQIFVLLGLFENANNGSQDWNDYDFSGSVDNDELAQRRKRLNWLSADSRWVTVNRAGRIITTENNISFDPRSADYLDGLSGTAQEKAREQRRRQLSGHLNSPGARQFAENMSASTGR
jgi:prepilin-type N-terminal cleavage/methylation domain-containing protein